MNLQFLCDNLRVLCVPCGAVEPGKNLTRRSHKVM